MQNPTQSQLSQTQKERLFHIDFRLYFLGSVNRNDLVSRFGIKEAAATRDITLYKELAPKNQEYDTKAKTYIQREGFSPLFSYSSHQALLEKTEDATEALANVFAEKGDILRNQLAFDTTTTASLNSYNDAPSFVDNYPFVPYHYPLVQKVFESIRTKGATGKHLAMGERSLLDAFQSAAKQVKDQCIGVLIPFIASTARLRAFWSLPSNARSIKLANSMF